MRPCSDKVKILVVNRFRQIIFKIFLHKIYNRIFFTDKLKSVLTHVQVQIISILLTHRTKHWKFVSKNTTQLFSKQQHSMAAQQASNPSSALLFLLPLSTTTVLVIIWPWGGP